MDEEKQAEFITTWMRNLANAQSFKEFYEIYRAMCTESKEKFNMGSQPDPDNKTAVFQLFKLVKSSKHTTYKDFYIA